MAGTNRDAHYAQPGSNCGFGANSQGQELTAHAGKKTGRELMKRTKKDFLNGFLNIWYPIPSPNSFCGKGEGGERRSPNRFSCKNWVIFNGYKTRQLMISHYCSKLPC